MSRTLPHSLVSEASLLGGILLVPTALAGVPHLEPRHFYDMRHQIVFAALRDLEARQRPIDVVTVERAIAARGQLEAIGGLAFLGELTLSPAIPDNVSAYGVTIAELAHARALAIAAAEIVEAVYDPDLDPVGYVDSAEHAILGVAAEARAQVADQDRPVGDVVRDRLKQIGELAAARQRGQAVLTGQPTGIAALDRAIGGWQPGVINLLAARPAMGKSAVALAAADAVSDAPGGGGVHVFSLEDSAANYADRCLARNAGVAMDVLRRADLDRQQVSLVMQAAARLHSKSRRWRIDAEPGLRAIDIIRRVRQHRAALQTRLVIVDYVQLVRRTPRLDENAALDEIMTAFQAAAKEDGERIAWLVLSQLNRKCEDRVDKRPVQSDLRGSGSLEERAKIIVGLYRGVYYDETPKLGVDYDCDCPPRTAVCPHQPDEATFRAQLQCLLLKNNQGDTGRVFATFHAPTLEIR